MTQPPAAIRSFTITVQSCSECPMALAYVEGVSFCSFQTSSEVKIGRRIQIHQENAYGLTGSCPACPKETQAPVEVKEDKNTSLAYSFSGSSGLEVMQSIIDQLDAVQARIIKKKIDGKSGCFYVLADCLRSHALKISKLLNVDAYRADFSGEKWIISMTTLMAEDAQVISPEVEVKSTLEDFSFFGYGKGDRMTQAADYLEDEGVVIAKRIYVESQYIFEIQGSCSQECADLIQNDGKLVVEKTK